jgi:hypothetical protein
LNFGAHSVHKRADEYTCYRCSDVDYKIANAGVAPRSMKLQSFNGRTESYPSGAQNPFASHVSRPEQKSGYQKY